MAELNVNIRIALNPRHPSVSEDERLSELENREEESRFLNLACKYLHVFFTVCQIIRLYSLIMLEDIEIAFMEVSNLFNFTSIGLDLAPAVNYILWHFVDFLLMSLFCHVGICGFLLAGNNIHVIIHDSVLSSEFVSEWVAWLDKKISEVFVSGLIVLCFTSVLFNDTKFHTLYQLESLVMAHFFFFLGAFKYFMMLIRANRVPH